MKANAWLGMGIAGAAVAALCCFTPALAVLLGFAGLSAAVGILDTVLLPALAISVGMIVYALYRKRGRQ
jgi:mercuric ion transport protein